MPNTRVELTRAEQRRLKAIAPDYRTLIKWIADYVRRFGDEIKIGRAYAPRYDTHISFDQEDWDVIEEWVQKRGRRKINHLKGFKSSKRELILHVAEKVLAQKQSENDRR